MPYTVTTYKSPAELQNAVGGTVTTHKDEDSLGAAILTSVGPFTVVVNGALYTMIDAPTVVNVSLQILSKGYFYTVILETA